MSIPLARNRTTLDAALDEFRAGRPVLAVDDLGGTGIDMMIAADTASVPAVAEMIREGSGFIFVTVTESDARRLCLPPMTWDQATNYSGRMCVAVDAIDGVTTGISAHDRAVTLRTLGDPLATPASFTRPGHVVPVLVEDTGTRNRPSLLAHTGHLCADGNTTMPVAFVSLESPNDPRRSAHIDEAAHWGLPTIRYSDLYRSATRTHRNVA